MLIVLFVSWLIFRGMGEFGIHGLATWRDSARYALAVMFLFTGTTLFTRIKHDMAKMIPSFFPRPMLLVYLTGALELLGAAGLLLPQFRSLAGICLIALLIGMFVGNANAALNGIMLRGKPATPHWLRGPMQVMFIALLWWSSR